MSQGAAFSDWLRSGGRYSVGIAVVGAVAAGALGFFGGQVRSKKSPVVFVKTSDVMARYKVAIAARESFQKETAAWAEEAKQLEKELGEKAKGANLTDPKVRESLQELRSRLDSLRQKGARREQELMQPVLAEVNAGIKKYAQKHGYPIVLGTLQGGVILHADEALDVTEGLIADLNK